MAIDRVSFGQVLQPGSSLDRWPSHVYFELHANFQRQYLQIELYREYGLAKTNHAPQPLCTKAL